MKITPKAAAGFAAILCVTLLLISKSGESISSDVEQPSQVSIVGRCFENGMNAVGKLVHVENRRWGLLAFPSGVTASYPFEALEPALCPGGDQPLDKEHVLEILKKNVGEE